MDSISRALLITGGITADLDPNAFGFNNVGGANLSTLTTSNTITPTGYDTPTAWSVTNGGQGSVNGGAYASSGTISPGQTLTVRGTSSSSLNTTTSFLVSIGATQSTWSITTKAQLDQAVYTTAGTYTFIVPAGVTSVSVVCVGGGMGGGISDGGKAGSLAWRNNIAVTPGASCTVVVGVGGAGRSNDQRGFDGTESSFSAPGGASVSAMGSQYASYNGDGGGNGAQITSSGGNGAGGYTGNGGNPGAAGDYQGTPGSGTAGTGGAGGGGGGSSFYGDDADQDGYFEYYGRTASGNGGGVGILGQGANGAGGFGGGGSGGAGSGGSGKFYGGGGGAGGMYWPPYQTYSGEAGGGGAVRIIWPGNTRLFPSTNTGTI